MCLNVKVLNDKKEEIKLREYTEEELEALEINIEGKEDVPVIKSTTELEGSNLQEIVEEKVEETDELEELEEVEVDEKEDDDDELPLDEFKKELQLDDFDDEH